MWARQLQRPSREAATPSADQPLVYRLSGDVFALHVSPDFAKASGFEKVNLIIKKK